jgi:hypothetical protein
MKPLRAGKRLSKRRRRQHDVLNENWKHVSLDLFALHSFDSHLDGNHHSYLHVGQAREHRMLSFQFELSLYDRGCYSPCEA